MIQIPIVSDYDSKGVRQAQKSFEDLRKQTGRVGASIRSVMLPAAAAVGALAVAGVSAVKSAIEDAKAQEMLARQLRVSANATDAQVAAVERQISAMSLATGVADDELRPAFAALVRATGSLGKGTKALRIAMDVAAATGKPLNRVVEAMARAYGGNVKALARLDPALRQFITKTTTADQAIAKMAASFRGASDVAANTLQGRMERLNVAFAEMREQIGSALLPVAEAFANVLANKLAPYGQKVADTFSEKGLGGVMKMLGKDIFNTWQNADGFAGALLDIAATAGVMFAAFKGWMVFSAIKDTLFAATGAVNGLRNAFLLFSGASTTAIVGAFGLITFTVGLLVSTLRNFEQRQYWAEFLSNSVKLVANAFIGLYKIVQAAINPIIGLINRLIPGGKNDIKLLGNIDFKDFTFDAGRPEFGTPRAFESSPMSQVTINVSGGDPNAVVDALTKWYRQNGPLPVAARG